ncbi:sporulation protein [Nocardia sp. CA-107356]|uniref:sporulation protein n=1 Tax=Nocardia sp. CA-107356 TaxID=3239972 RepID=UPI003D928CF4
MKYSELLTRVQDAITVRKVFGEAHESNGVTVIPAASVGGGGGGGGQGAEGVGGEGAGFGLGGAPVGAFVLRDGKLTWHPAVDVNALFATVGRVLIAGILAWAWLRSKQPTRG